MTSMIKLTSQEQEIKQGTKKKKKKERQQTYTYIHETTMALKVENLKDKR